MARKTSEIIGSLLSQDKFGTSTLEGEKPDQTVSSIKQKLQRERAKPVGMLTDILEEREERTPYEPKFDEGGAAIEFSTGGDPEHFFNSQLQRMIADAPGKISITSGKRDPEKQKQLWADALKKYGDPEIADNWVARPGTSKHESGLAADLSFADAATKKWFHENAAKYNLYFPMEHEPWHIQLQKEYEKGVPGPAAPREKSTGNPHLDYIIQHESNFDPHAQNPTSSAFGIGQMIRANREAYGKRFGFDPNTTDPNEQIIMMKAYVQDRYGSPEAAAAFKRKHGWY